LLLCHDKDNLLLIRMLSKTGVCPERLSEKTFEKLLTRLINVASRGEFVVVILPWLSAMAKVSSLEKLSDLVECLLGLLSDESGNLSEKVKAEIMEIYQTLSETLQNVD